MSKKTISVQIEEKTIAAVDRYCKKTGVSKVFFFNEALENLLGKVQRGRK